MSAGNIELAIPELVSILREGLTQNADETLGLSILSDVVAELDGLAGVVNGSPSAEHLVPLLLGMNRRLNAALKILRAELAAAGPAGAP